MLSIDDTADFPSFASSFATPPATVANLFMHVHYLFWTFILWAKPSQLTLGLSPYKRKVNLEATPTRL